MMRVASRGLITVKRAPRPEGKENGGKKKSTVETVDQAEAGPANTTNPRRNSPPFDRRECSQKVTDYRSAATSVRISLRTQPV